MVMRMSTGAEGLTVWLSGELDHHAAREMREQIDGAIRRSSAKTLWLDFSGITFMDSSGIGLIMGRYRLMLSRGGALFVVGASDRLLRVMKLAGLEKLPIWENGNTQQKEATRR